MIPTPSQVWLVVEPIDMRAGIDGLSQRIQNTLGRSPCDGSAYAFRNRRLTRLKLLVWDGNRRLRTVVGNRSVVLFSSDRDRQKIRVLPAAASALRQAMGIPELEGFDAYNDAVLEGAIDEEQGTCTDSMG